MEAGKSQCMYCGAAVKSASSAHDFGESLVIESLSIDSVGLHIAMRNAGREPATIEEVRLDGDHLPLRGLFQGYATLKGGRATIAPGYGVTVLAGVTKSGAKRVAANVLVNMATGRRYDLQVTLP